MKKHTYLPVAILLATTALCAGAMFHYRTRARHYEQQWSEAMEQLAARNTPRVQTRQTARPPVPGRESTGADLSDLHLEQDGLIAELIDELAQRDRQLAEMERVTAGTRRLPTPEERRQQFETLRETDPERYAEIIARQEAFRERMQEAFAGRAAVLHEIDPASMSQAELRQHRHLMETLQASWDLAQRMMSDDLPPEERRQIREQLVEVSQELRPLLADERNRRLVELGLSSGYSPEEARVFSEYIQQTFDATSAQRIPGMRGGPRAGGQ